MSTILISLKKYSLYFLLINTIGQRQLHNYLVDLLCGQLYTIKYINIILQKSKPFGINDAISQFKIIDIHYCQI